MPAEDREFADGHKSQSNGIAFPPRRSRANNPAARTTYERRPGGKFFR